MITKVIEIWFQLSWSKVKKKKKDYDKYFKDNINNMKNTWIWVKSIISLQKTTNE